MYLFNPILMINIKSTKFGPRASISIQLTNQITCFLCKPSLLVFCNMFFDFVCKSVHELDSKVILNLPTITNTFNQRKTFFQFLPSRKCEKNLYNYCSTLFTHKHIYVCLYVCMYAYGSGEPLQTHCCIQCQLFISTN